MVSFGLGDANTFASPPSVCAPSHRGPSFGVAVEKPTACAIDVAAEAPVGEVYDVGNLGSTRWLHIA